MMIRTPALVTREAAQRLPRLGLWLICGLYLLPGLFGRDPWRNAELTSFGVMLAMAQGRTAWLSPSLGMLPADAALPAHALGALSIMTLSPWGIDAALAARLPFLILLGLSMALIWHTCYHLARTEAALPLAFAFGGEAAPHDYARTLADGALLAFMATLGLLQLGHEATPELMQMTAVCLLLWSLASPTARPRPAAFVSVLALGLLAASGAAEMAAACGVAACLVSWRSADATLTPMRWWIGLGTLASVAWGLKFGTFRSTYEWPADGADVWQILRLLAWFTWPTAPLALLTLWRWRQQLMRRHIAVPALMAAIAVVQAIAVGGSDRALLLALPGVAVLAAFALPTLSRNSSAAVDWFSVFFFSSLAAGLWAIYLSFQTGWPEPPLRNAMAVAPDYSPVFQPLALSVALMGTLAWIWLVRWRTSRQRKALWKSLILPAGGVLLNWLLAMTLLLHPLDYTRSLTPWVERMREAVGHPNCLAAPGMQLAYVAALEAQAGWAVDARPLTQIQPQCSILVLTETREGGIPTMQGWEFKQRVRRPTERHFAALVYQRGQAASPAPAAAED